MAWRTTSSGGSRKTRTRLKIFGDGRQTKPYIHIDDVLAAFQLMEREQASGYDVFNVGTEDSLTVHDVADIVVDRMGLSNVRYEFTGGTRGWKADVPVYKLDTRKIRGRGWSSRRNSREAVTAAVDSMIRDLKAGQHHAGGLTPSPRGWRPSSAECGKSRMEKLLGDAPAKVFVTGGAGFIGSHLVDILVGQGYQATVYDNLSNGRRAVHRAPPRRAEFPVHRGRHPRRGPAGRRDGRARPGLAPGGQYGHHRRRGAAAPRSSRLRDGDLQRPRRRCGGRGIKPIIFSSTGAVYGELCHDVATSESDGPLLAVSTYAAGKIGSEAFISAFCSLYGLRGWMFRFGNVIGARMTHGVIFDFIRKLRENPEELLIRGDGNQEKNYFLVEECIDGMAYAYRNIPMTEDKPCDIFNLGTDSVTQGGGDRGGSSRKRWGCRRPAIRIEGTKRAWAGDQPKVHITVDRMRQLGWTREADFGPGGADRGAPHAGQGVIV